MDYIPNVWINHRLCWLTTDIFIYILVGGFNPSEKYARQLGLLFPIYGKIKFMFQTTNHYIFTDQTLPNLSRSPILPSQLQRPDRRANGPAGTGSRDGSLTPAMRAPKGCLFYCQSPNLCHVYRENELLKPVKRQSNHWGFLGSTFWEKYDQIHGLVTLQKAIEAMAQSK